MHAANPMIEIHNGSVQIASHDRTDYCRTITAGYTDETGDHNYTVFGDQLLKLIDNDLTSELFVPNMPAGFYIQFDFDAQVRLSGYSLTASQTSLTWHLRANVNNDWQGIDDIRNHTFGTETKCYIPWDPYPFSDKNLSTVNWTTLESKSFRLYLTGYNGNSDLRLNEFQIFGYDTDVKQSIINTPDGAISSNRSNNWVGQVIGDITDRNMDTKFCAVVWSGSICPIEIMYESPTAVSINKYTLTSADDATDRNPKSWKLQASNTNNGNDWVDLDTRDNQLFAGFFNTMEYAIPTTGLYKYFRLYITEINGPDAPNADNFFQLAEWQLFLDPIKVACIGNSITDWSGYPEFLQGLLGPQDYKVLNCGVGGATLLKNTGSPYWGVSKYTQALASNPDIVIIKLGTNDMPSWNWDTHGDEYEGDYMDLVASFQQLPSHPKIYLCYPLYAIFGYNGTIHNEDIVSKMIPKINNVAAAKGCEIIDFNTPFAGRYNLIPDGVHPSQEGAYDMAQIVYKAITCPECPAYDPFTRIASHDRTDYRSSTTSNFGASADDLESLFDNNPVTNLNIPSSASNVYVQVDFDAPVETSGYAITAETAKFSWELQGSNGNDAWTPIDTKENQDFAAGTRTVHFVDNLGNWANHSYQSFRLLITDKGGSGLNLSEWQIFGHPQSFESSVTNTPGGKITAAVLSAGEAMAGIDGEAVGKLIDRSASSKYCSAFCYAPVWIQYENPTPVSINKYTLTSANDAFERNPKAWVLQGSDNGTAWTDLDSQQNQDFAGYFHTMEYSIAPTYEYRYFRLYVTEYYGKISTFQLAEFQLFETQESMGTTIRKNEPNSFRIVPTVVAIGESLNITAPENGTLNIYSVQGTLISSMEVTKNTSSIRVNLTKGIYIARLMNANGKYSTKLVVK
ncbi:hypothetical protein FACS189413_05790 [Bacteroidia bacterium]|nr:hypothetical protein FACS189413_05790 [Bacteroidia bacterium]